MYTLKMIESWIEKEYNQRIYMLVLVTFLSKTCLHSDQLYAFKRLRTMFRDNLCDFFFRNINLDSHLKYVHPILLKSFSRN